MRDHELDVRRLPKPDKHPAIFKAFTALATGESLVLVNDHDPRHLRDEFEVEHPGGFGWEYLARDRGAFQIRITKLAATSLPRILADTAAVSVGQAHAAGVLWKLQMRERDLDSNIIALAPGASIDAHAGPDVDVLIHVLAGSGQLSTELDVLELRQGTLLWLPRRSRRQFAAGPDGLRYLTVHQRRQALTLTKAPAGGARRPERDETITVFLGKLAERTAAPAGGAAAALSAAQAAALLAMAARYCDGPAHAGRAAAIAETVTEADRLRDECTKLITADGESYGAVMAAYKLPKDTEEQRATRSAAISAALIAAAGPPAGVIAASARLLELARTLQPVVNNFIAPDVAAAVQTIAAAVATSRTNLEANLSGIADQPVRDHLTGIIARVAALESQAAELVSAVRARYA